MAYSIMRALFGSRPTGATNDLHSGRGRSATASVPVPIYDPQLRIVGWDFASDDGHGYLLPAGIQHDGGNDASNRGSIQMIEYRPTNPRTLQAAYLGTVRVGYVEERHAQFRWWTILIRPEGGQYTGREDHEDEAKLALERSIEHWVASAQLRRRD